MAARRFEQQVRYTEDILGEWEPFDPGVDTRDWRAEDYRRFVREFNARAKREGDRTRIRSVENEDAFS